MEHSALVHTYAQLPKPLSHGEGVYVWDMDGKRYIDFYGGHAVSLLGHRPQLVIDAIKAQGETLFFYSNVAALSVREAAAEALLDFANTELAKVFFCNSGAEANENALKLSIQLTGRQKFIAYKGSFHGRTHLAASVTDNSGWHKHTPAWNGPVEFLSANDKAALAQIDETVAAVILEPIQSIAGVIEFSFDYLVALKKRCEEVGALLIFDEIQTGMGRTGCPLVAGSCGVTPDFVTLAKGLGSGFPVGALLMSRSIADQVKLGDLGSTFGGGPLACAAILATIEEVGSRLEHVREIERCIRRELPFVEIRGRGCLLGLKLPMEAEPVMNELFARGIITGTSKDKTVLRLLPPLTIESSHVHELATQLREVFSSSHEELSQHASL